MNASDNPNKMWGSSPTWSTTNKDLPKADLLLYVRFSSYLGCDIYSNTNI